MVFDPKDIRFTPAGIGSLTDEELRAAYEDLAGTAKSELNRIKRSKVFGDAAVVERNKDYYPSLKKIDSYYNPRRELEWRTVEAAAQLRSEHGTLEGLYRIRDKQIAALHDAKYTKINKRNYRQAIEWLTANNAGFLPSDQILDIFNALPQKTKLETDVLKITETKNLKSLRLPWRQPKRVDLWGRNINRLGRTSVDALSWSGARSRLHISRRSSKVTTAKHWTR